jgi:hypothetical protein
VRRGVVPGIRRRIAGESRSRRVAGAVAAIVAGAVALGVLLSAGLPGSSRGATSPRRASGSATVERRDLIATDTVAGTLSYAKPQTVFNRMSGTITALPTVGAVVRPGQTLYRVDGAPAVLFDGTVPAYRTLTSGVTDGPDVQELKQNLVNLGFDPSHQITVNQTLDAATITAIDAWQASLGQTQTGTVTLGQVVFLPGPQRITAVDAVLGSTGGSSGSGSGSGSSSTTGASTAASGTTTSATSYSPVPRTEFVSFTTTSAATTSAASHPAGSTTAASTIAAAGSTPPATTSSSTEATSKATCPAGPPNQTQTPPTGSSPASTCPKPSGSPTAQELLAQLVAELKKLAASSSSGSSGRSSGSASGSAGTSGSSGGRSPGGGGGGAGTSSSAATGGGSSAGTSSAGTSSAGSGSATPILQTTSTQVIVSVALDATKQSEAVVGEPVSVQLPDGSTADGKVTTVSPVAQSTSSSSSSSSSAGGGGGSTTPSATIPVTVALHGRQPTGGLDQAAVSVNFQQQVERNVLSVPVTALLATAGGRYAVQEANAPHSLIPVTPGLFAAGFVQISGPQIYPGLQVTDSQG